MSDFLPQPAISPAGRLVLPDPGARPPEQRHRGGHLPAPRPVRDLGAPGVGRAAARRGPGDRRRGHDLRPGARRGHPTATPGEEFAELLETEGAGFGVEPSLSGLQAGARRAGLPARPALELFAEAVTEPALADEDVSRTWPAAAGRDRAGPGQLRPDRQPSPSGRAVFAETARASRMNGGEPRPWPRSPRGRVRRFHRDLVGPAGCDAGAGRRLRRRSRRAGRAVPGRLAESRTASGRSRRCPTPAAADAAARRPSRARCRPTSASAASASTGWTLGGPTAQCGQLRRWAEPSCPG